MLRIVMLTATTLLVLLPGVLAAAELDVMDCRSMSVTLVHGSKDITLVGVELKGILVSRNGDTAWDAASSQCVGVAHIGEAARASNGYCKLQDAGGNFAFVDWKRTSRTGGDWSFLGGTGKWKGINGGGAWKDFKRAKSIAPGTAQSCIEITGTYQVAG